MVGSCQVSAEPFGVVLIRSGEEVGAVARPERIGCTARLVRVDRFPDGTMDILSVGEHRFALQASPRVAPEGYLIGMTRVTTDEDLPGDLPAELIESVTATAAAVIKRPDLGVITPGATADLTVVDLTHPHLQPLFDPRRGLVALGNRANIDQVIVDGRVLIDAGRYIHGDETAIISAASAAIGKIWDLPEAQAAFNG
jgi:hypothetical protein